MLDTATFVRIFEANPSDDFVTKRDEAIEVLAKKFGETKSVDGLLGIGHALAAGITGGTLPSPFGADVEAAIKGCSSAYVLDGNEMQAVVCGLLAAARVMKAGAQGDEWFTVTSVLAAGLWLALSHVSASLQPKVQQLCDAVRDKAQQHLIAVAESSRRRREVPAAKVEWPAGGDGPKIEKAIEEGLAATIDALGANAVLDREEIDILWWTLGDRSSLLDQRFSTVPPVHAPIAAAVELGRLLRRPPAEAHKHLVLRHVREDEPLTLEGLLAELQPVRAKFSLPAAELARARQYPHVFPLLHAIAIEGRDTTASDGARRLSEWSARALAESAVLHLSGTPHPGV